MRRWVAPASLVLLPPLLLAGSIPMGGVSALEDDLLYYLPQRAYLGQAVRGGEFPLWNPYVAMGTPMAADPQVGMWYPPTYLFAVLPPFAAYLITLWLHFVLAGAGMYRLGRILGRSRYASLFASIAFELGGFLIAHRAHLTILESAAWLPWILYAWERAATRGRGRDFTLAVLNLGLQLLVQHVQVSAVTLTIVCVQLGMLHSRRLRLLWQFPAGVLLAAGIAAIQWMPTFAFFARCTRSESTFDTFIENSIWPQSAILLFWPMIFGTRTPNFYATPYWGPSHWCEQAIYPSLIVLVLAMAAVGSWRRDRQVRCWLVAAGVCFFLALGQFNPLSPKLFELPLFSSFRAPARWMLASSLILPLLAARTLDDFLAGEAATIRRVLRCLTVALPSLMAVSLVGALVLARTGQIPFNEIADTGVRLSPLQPAVYVPIGLLVLTVAVLAGFRGRPHRRAVGIPVVLIADLASVAAFVDVDLSTYPGREAVVRSALADYIRDAGGEEPGRLWVPRPEADYRLPLEILWPNTNLLHGVPTLHGYGPLVPQEYRALLQMRPWGSCDAALDLLCRPALLEALGVRWVAVRSRAERDVLRQARRLPDACPLEPLTPADQWMSAAGTDEVRCPISLSRRDLYRLEFTVRPRYLGTGTRFYVSLEDEKRQAIVPMRMFEPADMAFGQRRLRLHFAIERSADAAWLRIASFRGSGVEIRDVAFGGVEARENDEGFPVPARRIGEVEVFELPDPASRVSFARQAVAADSIASAMDYLTVSGQSEALRDVAVVVPAGPLPACPPGARVLKVFSTSNRVEVSVEAPVGGFLVFRDSFDPGWHATVDGRPVPVRRTNVVCGGVEVPAGARRLVLSFRPECFGMGAGVSVTAIAALLGSWWGMRYNMLGRQPFPTRTDVC